MSTNGETVLEQFRALPLDERREVLNTAREFHERAMQWEQEKARLRELQSRHARRGLLGVLLEEQAKERSRG
jgi:hypothetical protein